MKKTLFTLSLLFSAAASATSDVIPVEITQSTVCAPAIQEKSENALEKQQFNNGFSTKKYPKKFNNKFRQDNKFNGPTLTEKAEKWHKRNEEHFSDIKQQLAGTKAEHKEALDLIKKEVARVEQELKQEIAHVKDLIMAQHVQEAEPLFVEQEEGKKDFLPEQQMEIINEVEG